jgi:hypothetical protein
MAIILMEGFEGFGNYQDLERRYRGGFLSSSGPQTGRDGSGQAYGLNFNSVYVNMNYVMTGDFLCVGFAFMKEDPFDSRDIIQIMAETAGSQQLTLRFDSQGDLYLDRGATNIDSAVVGLSSNQWNYIEIAVTFGDGTAGSYDVFVNGSNVMTGTSVDTRNVTGENSAYLNLIGGSSGNHVFDDIYVLDGSGSDQTTRIGPCIIETVIPDADGTTNDFTAQGAGANYVEVDDGNSPDDDTTYNSSSTATHKDLYGHAALAGDIDTVYAVMPRSYVRLASGGTRGVQNVARSSATEVNGDEKFIDQSYVYVDHIYENDPNGGGAWSESSVNAAEFGLRIST